MVLFVLITTLTLVEIALIFVLANLTGWLVTILIALVTAIVGALMIRVAGISVWRRFHSELQSGRFPGEAIAEGALILVGGAFLMTPGLITDLVGITTLIPQTRRLYARFIVRWASRSIVAVPMGGAAGAGMGSMFGSAMGAGQQPKAAPEPGGPTVFNVPPDVEEARRADSGTDEAVDVEFRRTE